MARVPVHFIGFLANVDDSITKLELGDGFVTERRSSSDVMPFLRCIDSFWGTCGRDDIPSGGFCVVKPNLAAFEATGRGGAAIRGDICEQTHMFVRGKLRLLRLFKEGNVVLPYSFVYQTSQGEEDPFSPVREHPIVDREQFTLTPTGIPEAQSFIDSVSLPLREPSVQLAFESFDLSYEIHDASLAFPSLMIAAEILLHPGNRDELKYRICRKASVLLGQDPSRGETVFGEIKSLYDRRSALVHSGDRSSVTRQDVVKLRQYVR
ncbi:MAG: hypothetical protein KBE65_07175 [Phycisphaerae bacterium]|nr:hypothetical protein [Phycisphaerae bacterium]